MRLSVPLLALSSSLTRWITAAFAGNQGLFVYMCVRECVLSRRQKWFVPTGWPLKLLGNEGHMYSIVYMQSWLTLSYAIVAWSMPWVYVSLCCSLTSFSCFHLSFLLSLFLFLRSSSLSSFFFFWVGRREEEEEGGNLIGLLGFCSAKSMNINYVKYFVCSLESKFLRFK